VYCSVLLFVGVVDSPFILYILFGLIYVIVDSLEFSAFCFVLPFIYSFGSLVVAFHISDCVVA
jgi:hypothetical protein